MTGRAERVDDCLRTSMLLSGFVSKHSTHIGKRGDFSRVDGCLSLPRYALLELRHHCIIQKSRVTSFETFSVENKSLLFNFWINFG